MLEATHRSIGKRSKSTPAAQLSTTQNNSSHTFPRFDGGNGSTLSSTALDESTVVRLLLDSSKASCRRRQPGCPAALQLRRRQWHYETAAVPDSTDGQRKLPHQRYLQPLVGAGGKGDREVLKRATRASVTFTPATSNVDAANDIRGSVGSVEQEIGLRERLHQVNNDCT
jgi:hypothetical protein